MKLREHMQKAKALFYDRPHLDAQTCIAIIAPDAVFFEVALQWWLKSGQRFDVAIEKAAE